MRQRPGQPDAAAALSTLSSAIAASHAEAFAALRSVDRRREGVLPLPLAAEALSRLPLLSLSRAQVLAALAEAARAQTGSPAAPLHYLRFLRQAVAPAPAPANAPRRRATPLSPRPLRPTNPTLTLTLTLT